MYVVILNCSIFRVCLFSARYRTHNMRLHIVKAIENAMTYTMQTIKAQRDITVVKLTT